MSKRLVVVGGATAVAGLVLGASIVFGPPAVTGGSPQVPDIDAPNLSGKPTDNPNSFSAKIKGFGYTLIEVDDDGEVRGIRLRAERTNVKRLDVTELIRPRADIRLGSQRAITLTADNADMVMEGEKPREGTFSGNVVITLLQAPEGTTLIIDPKDPAHQPFIQQRIYLDEVTEFNIEESRINTAGPVHVTSPQVDFFGIGLNLTYNTQRERIEQLIVTEGRYLIYNPDAQAPAFEKTNAKADADDPAPIEQQPPGPSQFYNATFLDQVVVRDGIENELGGDQLSIGFSLGTEAVSPEPIAPRTSGLPILLALPGGQLAQVELDNENPQAGPIAPVLPAVVIPQRNAQRSLFDHDPQRDLLVTWAGTLTVLPLPKKPEKLADDDDVLISLTGENAYAQTTRDGEVQRIETPELQYLLSQELTKALAGQDKPIRIYSTKLGGEIIGQRLTVNPQAGTAQILGPGELVYTNEDDGKKLKLTWSKLLHLELYTEVDHAPLKEGEAEEDRITQTKILGVKTATFDGDVTARHPDFDLDSDKLTLAFVKPDKKNKIDNTPSSINASGNIVVKARGDEEDETFDINAHRLTILLELDEEDEPYASTIRAIDQVKITQPGLVMTCNSVEVELNPPSKDKDNAEDQDGQDKEPYAEVRSIFAVGNVVAKIDNDERRLDLVADQLIGDVERNRLTLSANNDNRPVEVIDIAKDQKLTGKLVVMDNQAEVLEIIGTGSLATKISDPNDPDAGIEDAFLTINWTESMMFNNVTGHAEFIGNVRSESQRSIDSSELTCDQLNMLFSPDYEHDPIRLIDDDGKDAHDRQIRSAVAKGNVQFIASAWETGAPGKITNRMMLRGPKVIITNQPATAIDEQPIETLVVEGQGLMQLEDYRPPQGQDGQDKATSKANMTGRGKTVFLWQDKMILDAQANTAVLTDTVQMVHIPKDKDGKDGDSVQLDCNRLVADMVDTGGLSVWMSDDAPDAQVTMITADDNVYLTQKRLRTMHGDHLKFAAVSNNVELWTDPGKLVEIRDLESDTSSLTQKVVWDLTTDQIEFKAVQGGGAPLN